MTAPIKNSVSPTAEAIPIRRTRKPISKPSAPAALSTPRIGSDDSRTPQPVHVGEKPIRPHKVIRCRVDVGRGSQERDNDVGDKHDTSLQLCHFGTPMTLWISVPPKQHCTWMRKERLREHEDCAVRSDLVFNVQGMKEIDT